MESIDDPKPNTADRDSDVDDDILQLACRMAYNMLQEGDDDSIAARAHIDPITTVCPDRNPNKPRGRYGSPQPTLKGFSFDGHESPPPPPADVFLEDDGPNTLYGGVAHQFAHTKLSDEEPTRRRRDKGGGFQSRQTNFNKDSTVTEQRGSVKWGGKQRVSSGGGGGRRYGVRPSTRQRQERVGTGEVMTALFLGRPGSKAGSTFGTGVFLPPGAGGAIESRKQRGCSTALIPARVLQALTLSRQHLGLLSPSQTTVPHQLLDHGIVGRRSSSLSTSASQRPMPEISHQDHEMGLPREWTY